LSRYASAGSHNTKHTQTTHVTLSYEYLEIQWGSRDCQVHGHTKFHQAKCSGSWVIVSTEKKNSDENNTVIVTADSNKQFVVKQ